VLLHLLRKHGFRTPLADEESFLPTGTVSLFATLTKSDCWFRLMKRDSSVAVISVNIFKPLRSLPHNDIHLNLTPIGLSRNDAVLLNPG
jgi:hypothetical protein